MDHTSDHTSDHTPTNEFMSNADVAQVFERMADLLDIEGANTFRVRAYRRAAQVLESLPQAVAEMVKKHEPLDELPGIGSDLAGKIEEVLKTGHLRALEEAEQRTPPELTELLKVGSLGPKRVHALQSELGVTGLDELIKAAREHRIRELTGFGVKTEEKILKEALKLASSTENKRVRRDRVEGLAEGLTRFLKEGKGVKEVVVAGSYRRKRETVGDLDVLITASPQSDVMDRFVKHPEVRDVLSHGSTRSTVIMKNGLQVDVRAVEEDSYGAALYYFTGSKEHVIAVRTLAQQAGLKINEYGVFRDDERIAGRTEKEVFATVGLPYIDPELRENKGEIEAAKHGRLPRLVAVADLKGDLHAHTTASDGRNSLEDMVATAQRLGYQYLAITEHSQSLKVAHGLDEDRLARRLDEIDRFNESLNGFRVLKGAEVDILENGELDYPPSLLKRLDLAVCSVHSHFDLSREKQTERLLRALENPYCDILGHPTGRQLGFREPYDVDLERVLQKAHDAGCAVEVDSQPERLDLNDTGCRLAKDLGVKVVIDSDAHGTEGLARIRFGVDQARRGWIEPEDVLNTKPLDEFLRSLRRHH
jgi:DNA polymerase (family 10)